MLLRKTTIGLLAGTLMLGCVSIAYGKDAGGKIQRETHKAYDEEENQKDLYGADDAFDDADGRTQGEETEAAASSRPEDDPAALLPVHAYTLTGSVEVEGRQGVCAEGGREPAFRGGEVAGPLAGHRRAAGPLHGLARREHGACGLRLPERRVALRVPRSPHEPPAVDLPPVIS